MSLKEMLYNVDIEFPEGKTIDDLTGGNVEVLRNKTNISLYFGNDKNRNKIYSKFEINNEENLSMLWLSSIREEVFKKQLNNKNKDIEDEEPLVW